MVAIVINTVHNTLATHVHHVPTTHYGDYAPTQMATRVLTSDH